MRLGRRASESVASDKSEYYAYDGRGNQTRRSVLGGDTVYFEYNSRNLITRIDSTKPGFTPNTFKYNALGQRITKTDSTGFTRYVWDGLNILLELDAAGNVKRRYTYGYSPIEGVSTLISVHDELGCPCFYHFDQVGGVRQLTDRWQNAIKAYEFEPFGRILAEAGNAPNHFAFPGTYLMVNDIELLRLSPWRAYQPLLACFLQRDPLARVNVLLSAHLGSNGMSEAVRSAASHHQPNVGGRLREHPYSYVGSQPVSQCDPTGLHIFSVGFINCRNKKCWCAELTAAQDPFARLWNQATKMAGPVLRLPGSPARSFTDAPGWVKVCSLHKAFKNSGKHEECLIECLRKHEPTLYNYYDLVDRSGSQTLTGFLGVVAGTLAGAATVAVKVPEPTQASKAFAGISYGLAALIGTWAGFRAAAHSTEGARVHRAMTLSAICEQVFQVVTPYGLWEELYIVFPGLRPEAELTIYPADVRR